MKIPKIYLTKMGALITPYHNRQCRELEYTTSLYDTVYHKSKPYVGFSVPYDGSNSFITYRNDKSFFLKNFPSYEIIEQVIGRTEKMKYPIQLKGIDSFRSAQSQIIGDLESSVKTNRAWFINLQTGEGKTLLSIYWCTRLRLKTIIMCFSNSILDQWVESFSRYTDIDQSRILRLRTSAEINKLLADKGTHKTTVDDFDICICTPGVLSSGANNLGDYKLIYDFFDKFGFGLLIFDEAHLNVGNLVRINSVTNVRYQLYLSADFGQGDHIKDMIYRKIFREVPILTPSEELKSTLKYTTLMVVDFNTHPNEVEEGLVFNRYGFSEIKYIQYEFMKPTLLNALDHIIDMILKTNTKYKILILISTIEHVDVAYDYYKSKFAEMNSDFKVGRFHGNLDDVEKDYTRNHADLIIATYKSFSTGIDVKDIKYVLTTNQCNKVVDNQSAGRARPLSDGTNAMYFMFVDTGFKYCKRKLSTRLQYLKETKAGDEEVYQYHYIPDNEIVLD